MLTGMPAALSAVGLTAIHKPFLQPVSTVVPTVVLTMVLTAMSAVVLEPYCKQLY